MKLVLQDFVIVSVSDNSIKTLFAQKPHKGFISLMGRKERIMTKRDFQNFKERLLF